MSDVDNELVVHPDHRIPLGFSEFLKNKDLMQFDANSGTMGLSFVSLIPKKILKVEISCMVCITYMEEENQRSTSMAIFGD